MQQKNLYEMKRIASDKFEIGGSGKYLLENPNIDSFNIHLENITWQEH